MQTHQEWLDGENEPTEHEKRVAMFERTARARGYSTDKDEHARYEDNWLREAWNIFASIPKADLKAI